jgi:hypothetical protein
MGAAGVAPGHWNLLDAAAMALTAATDAYAHNVRRHFGGLHA